MRAQPFISKILRLRSLRFFMISYKKTLLCLLMLGAAPLWAQSKLGPCPRVDYTKNTHQERYGQWHNCFGRYRAELNDDNRGDLYEGEFQNGTFNGQGTYTSARGEKYIGEYKDGKHHGRGTYTFVAGDKYAGEYRDGNLNGQGTYTFANGSKYIGEHKDGKFNGHGTYYHNTPGENKGDVYVGEFKSGTYQGQGTYTFVNGNKFVGEFQENLPNGMGTFYFISGDRYTGEFKGWARQGKGILVYADGSKQEGWWEKDKFVRAERLNLPMPNNPTADAERRQLEAERQLLAQERQRLEQERNRREQAKQASRLSVNVRVTEPDATGMFTISISTGADTSSLMINDEEQGGRADGRYEIRKVARVGQATNYQISAIDVNGNKDSKTITVSRKLSDSSPSYIRLNPANIKVQPSRDMVAIIVGIQNYKRIPKAEYANDDAQDFYDYAIRALGVKPENIKLLIDDGADEVDILAAFRNWLPMKVKKNKTDLVVFYSGHGLPSEDGKSLYFLPYNAHRELIEETAINQSKIVSAIQSAQPRSVTMFIDACYSGQARSGETLMASAKPLAMKSVAGSYPEGFTVITASQPDQISWSSANLKHGIFSFYVMKGLEGDADENKDGKITAGELQNYLTDMVPRQAMSMSRKQMPQLVGDTERVLVGR